MIVHLVDGTYELFRTYYGAPPGKAHGKEVGATRGLVRSLASWIKKEGVTHAAVAFDHVIESFRNDLYDGYKTGEGMDPDLYAQFELAERACAALGLVVWPMVEFEADDALAAGAARFSGEKKVTQVQICSPDKDLMQCVRGKVVTNDRHRGIIYDDAGVRAKFGVGPESIPDLLGLVGDDADGIPGVPRWGMKSAATVLSVYGCIEKIPADVKKWTCKVRGAEALAESLGAHRKEAALWKQLATLREDVPLTEGLAEMTYKGPTSKLKELWDELDMTPP